MKTLIAPAVLLCLSLGLGCAGERTPANDTGSQGATSHSAPGADGVLHLGAAVVDAPSGWDFHRPSSSMRLAEAEVPGPAGPALLTVFFFGPGGGGDVQANLQRWLGQIEATPGSTPVERRLEADGFSIWEVTVAGTLLPSTMGAGPTEPMPGSRLLGAVVEGPGGPWFFKMTGPEDTVSAASAEFERMLLSVRPAARTT